MVDYVNIGAKTYEDGFSYQDYNELQQNIDHFRQTRHGCRVRHSTTQSTTSGSSLVLAFDTEAYDPAGLHDTVTNNSRLTAQQRGYYYIFGNIQWEGNGTGSRLMEILLNGTTVIARARWFGSVVYQWVACEYVLAVNDYVELDVTQNSGVALDVTVDAELGFGMRWLAGDAA